MRSFQITSPANGKTFSVGSVVEANGDHTLDTASFVWAILRDIFDHYYLQNPPVLLNPNGNWQAKNLHLGHDILEILFVKVTSDGNSLFLRKVKNNDWGAFDVLPVGTEVLGRVGVNIR